MCFVLVWNFMQTWPVGDITPGVDSWHHPSAPEEQPDESPEKVKSVNGKAKVDNHESNLPICLAADFITVPFNFKFERYGSRLKVPDKVPRRRRYVIIWNCMYPKEFPRDSSHGTSVPFGRKMKVQLRIPQPAPIPMFVHDLVVWLWHEEGPIAMYCTALSF